MNFGGILRTDEICASKHTKREFDLPKPADELGIPRMYEKSTGGRNAIDQCLMPTP